MVERCPEPTCQCQPMPSNLDIDYKRDLFATVAPHGEHVLINTGTFDWPSRIEDDERFQSKQIKDSIRRAAESDSLRLSRAANFLPTLLSNSSLHQFSNLEKQSHSLSLLGAGLHVALPSRWKDLLFHPDGSGQLSLDHLSSVKIAEVIVLICGHGARDSRCGIMGPLLEQEFKAQFSTTGIEPLNDPVNLDTANRENVEDVHRSSMKARVGMISHVGGHAFAGNVIIYIPQTKQFTSHPLAGSRVWYGRVQPSHVEGIIQKTIRNGVIIKELLRWHSPLKH